MPIDLDAEYNNRSRVPEHLEIMAGWSRDAAAYRDAAIKAEIDVTYGPSARQKLDIFFASAPRPNAPTLLFIHGGYWQALDKSSFSHMARGANIHGLDVAVMSYDLCPDVHIGDIVDQCIVATRFLRVRFSRAVLPFGHSAGGHLAACLAGAAWPAFGEDRSIVAACMPISGLFHLGPLAGTFLNEVLKLDPAACSRLSPITWSPRPGLAVAAVVGGEESAEYHRQTRTLVECWSAMGADATSLVAPGKNHFTVISDFAEADMPLTRELAAIALA